MILLCGIPTEAPIETVWKALVGRGARVVVWNQRQFSSLDLVYDVHETGIDGHFVVGDSRYALSSFRGIYTRAIPDDVVLQAADPCPSPEASAHCVAVHQRLHAWCDVAPCRVVNRPAAMGSNASKPYQAERIRRHGFAVPETLVTNDPDAVLAFRRQHGTVIYKSLSGVRSIVKKLDDDAMERLDRIRGCPVQFQRWVPGTDVRVHVVGERIFATQIQSTATDYRYAGASGDSPTKMRVTELSTPVATNCIELARALDLPVAGIDLRFDPSGSVFCFEVNPSPGFTFYERTTGQPIGAAIAGYLLGE